MNLIKNRNELKSWIRRDAERNGISSWLRWKFYLFIKTENACVIDYLRTLRKYEYHLNNNHVLWHKIWSRFYQIRWSQKGKKYNLRIWPNCVGPGLRIPHIVGGVIVNCEAMGCDCSCNAGVIIGNKDSQDNRATIGNNVSFLVGAKLFGKITVCDNACIAPGAIVTHDVPANAIVAGIPAKVIKYRK